MSASQQENCIFCKIAHGEIPCTSVFESEDLIAFLDISPVNKGHTLLVPKAHMETLFDVPGGIGENVLAAMKRVGAAVMAATGAEGLNVVQNNYPAAGQQVPHVHWHLIPRFAGDGHTAWPQGAYQDMREMAALADAIRGKL
ncbi:HIT family protein [uncultured Bilophila sp.]|uniref:HIT family protein n=1 Tax=uncultured Bilophila sp. TaxID=529385 RepID=UPI00280A9B44|nr:HIT family protein [uncultured Bilophila sp.]